MAKVSVIVPCYNHAQYLQQRLQTIVLQKFQDFELILLDDASTDSSVTLLEKFAAATAAKTCFNQTNSGNTFTQWNEGAQLATGEYLWFAESDDYAHPGLLANLVTLLDQHPSVGLAYSQSVWVDEHNQLLGVAPHYYQSLPRFNRWRQNYVNDGQVEIQDYLAQISTIPNASAVLVRRAAFNQIGGADETFRLSGDWVTWLRILATWDVAYCAQPLNYFRQHPTTVRSSADKNGLFIEEYYRVQSLLPRLLQIPSATRRRAFNFVSYNWFRAGITGRLPAETSRQLYKFARSIDANLPWRMLKYIAKYPGRIFVYHEKPNLAFLAQIISLIATNGSIG